MFIYTLSMTVVISIVLVLGGPLYNSVEGSHHALTHAILVSLIFTVVYFSMKIMEVLKTIKGNFNDKSDD